MAIKKRRKEIETMKESKTKSQVLPSNGVGSGALIG